MWCQDSKIESLSFFMFYRPDKIVPNIILCNDITSIMVCKIKLRIHPIPIDKMVLGATRSFCSSFFGFFSLEFSYI